jgi:hypothetical protein
MLVDRPKASWNKAFMTKENDPRAAALLARAGGQVQPALVDWLLHTFETLESTDFGELEPVGVASPVAAPVTATVRQR